MSDSRDAHPLQTFGLKATYVYLILLFGGVPVAAVLDAIELEPLALNELGDFLAGAFGPLAIFWLVLGFFQQGNELRHSVQALELQAEELKNSVEQQKAMVGITERQLNLDIEVRDEQTKLAISRELPYFQATSSGSSGAGNNPPTRRFGYKLTNIGADAASVSLTLNTDTVSLSPPQFNYTPTQKVSDFSITTIRGTNFPDNLEVILTVRCENVRGQTRQQTFSIGNFHPKLLSCEPAQV